MLAATTGPFLYLKRNVLKYVARTLNQPSSSTLKKSHFRHSIAIASALPSLRTQGRILMTKALSLFLMMSVFRTRVEDPIQAFR
jgi:hypothetical protein